MLARRLAAPSDLARLAIARLERTEDAARSLRDVPDEAERLHDYRRECRRLEATLILVEGALRPTAIVQARALAESLPRGLGKHRDADVLRRRLDTAGDEARREAAREITLIRRDLRTSDAGRRRDVERATRRAKKKVLRRPVEAILADLDSGEVDPLAHQIARTRLRLKAATRPNASLASLHAMRLEGKLLRYGLDEMVAIEPSLREPAKEAEEMTDALGRITDAVALRALAREHRKKRPVGADHLQHIADTEEAAGREAFLSGFARHSWPRLVEILELPSPTARTGDPATHIAAP